MGHASPEFTARRRTECGDFGIGISGERKNFYLFDLINYIIDFVM
jgi:hypothetical protein